MRTWPSTRPAPPYPTGDPPLCRACANLAVRFCPELARGYVHLAPHAWAITAVRGQVADPVGGGFGHPHVLDLPTATATPDRDALRLMLAKGLIATLYDAAPRTDPYQITGLGVRLDATPSATSPPQTV